MRSPGINGERELSGQPANQGSPGKMVVKMECVCVLRHWWLGDRKGIWPVKKLAVGLLVVMT